MQHYVLYIKYTFIKNIFTISIKTTLLSTPCTEVKELLVWSFSCFCFFSFFVFLCFVCGKLRENPKTLLCPRSTSCVLGTSVRCMVLFWLLLRIVEPAFWWEDCTTSIPFCTRVTMSCPLFPILYPGSSTYITRSRKHSTRSSAFRRAAGELRSVPVWAAAHFEWEFCLCFCSNPVPCFHLTHTERCSLESPSLLFNSTFKEKKRGFVVLTVCVFVYGAISLNGTCLFLASYLVCQ